MDQTSAEKKPEEKQEAVATKPENQTVEQQKEVVPQTEKKNEEQPVKEEKKVEVKIEEKKAEVKIEEKKNEDKLEEIKQDNSTSDNKPITVFVVDPIKKDKTVSQYIIYTVKGEDKDGTFEVQRRYSDFDKLRSILVLRWPGCFISPLPPKQVMGNLEDKFIDERRQYLENFLQQVALVKSIWASDELQIFIRNPSGDLDKAFSSLPKQTNEDLRVKYEKCFGEILKKEITSEIKEKIFKYQKYVKDVIKQISTYKQIVEKIISVRRNHIDTFDKVLVNVFPQYEMNVLREYCNSITEGKVVFDQPDVSTAVTKIKEISEKHQLGEFLDILKMEILDAEAFIQCFEIKQSYEAQQQKVNDKLKEAQLEYSEIQAGKTKFTDIFKSKQTKEQKIGIINAKIADIKKEQQLIDFLTHSIIKLLGHQEIDKHKSLKVQKYYCTMKKIAQIEIDISKAKQELWQMVSQNKNVVSQQ